MQKILKTSLCVLLAFSLLVCCVPLTCFAAGKTVAGYKNTTYSGTADAYEMVYGVKNYISSYSTTYKEAYQVTKSDFYDKTKTIKYWAAHGTNAGSMWGTSNNVQVNIFNDYSNFSWAGGNLEFVFLAVCKQLDGLGSNPRAEYARAMIGDRAVRTVCGYHEAAPSGIDDDIARKFLEYAKTEESVKSSWILANTYYANLGYSTRDYLVLTHSGAVQYSRFEGFSDTIYNRPDASSTTILRFSSTGSNTQPTKGTTANSIIHGLEFTCDISALNNLSIPDNELIAESTIPVLRHSSGVKMITDENASSAVIKEVGHTPTSLTEDEALILAQKWISSNYGNITLSSSRNAGIEITPIVMAEVNLDGGEETEYVVAYSICQMNSFNGIPILGDHCNIMLDDEGAIFTSIKWAEYTEVDNENHRNTNMSISFSDAAEMLHSHLTSSERYANYIAGGSTRDTIEIQSAELVYAYNSDTNTYQPCWRFTVEGYAFILVNCFTGNIVEM
jgi:hypothetical protein